MCVLFSHVVQNFLYYASLNLRLVQVVSAISIKYIVINFF